MTSEIISTLPRRLLHPTKAHSFSDEATNCPSYFDCICNYLSVLLYSNIVSNGTAFQHYRTSDIPCHRSLLILYRLSGSPRNKYPPTKTSPTPHFIAILLLSTIPPIRLLSLQIKWRNIFPPSASLNPHGDSRCIDSTTIIPTLTNCSSSSQVLERSALAGRGMRRTRAGPKLMWRRGMPC